MTWAFVEECCLELAAVYCAYVPSPLKDKLLAVFSVQPTAVIEQSFNAMRHAEIHNQKSKIMSHCRKWWSPVDRGILRKQHSYQEVP